MVIFPLDPATMAAGFSAGQRQWRTMQCAFPYIPLQRDATGSNEKSSFMNGTCMLVVHCSGQLLVRFLFAEKKKRFAGVGGRSVGYRLQRCGSNIDEEKSV